MNEILGNIPMDILITLINVVLLLITLIFTFKNSSRIKKLRKRYNKFMDGLSDRSMEQLLDTCLDDLKIVKTKNKEIENEINRIERDLLQCIQKVGIVRYNAFENVGSDLSYSIALLDNNENGVVISSIFTRESSTTYAKPIVGGKSRYTLSAEEMQALDNAKRTNSERVYAPGGLNTK